MFLGSVIQRWFDMRIFFRRSVHRTWLTDLPHPLSSRSLSSVVCNSTLCPANIPRLFLSGLTLSAKPASAGSCRLKCDSVDWSVVCNSWSCTASVHRYVTSVNCHRVSRHKAMRVKGVIMSLAVYYWMGDVHHCSGLSSPKWPILCRVGR